MYGHLNRQISEISHDKTWIRKGNLKRETKPLLIAAQYSAIKTNCFKSKIDKREQNSKYKLCGDREKMVDHIKSQCSKHAQKDYKTRHDRVGKLTRWELCKKLKFEHTSKWYTHNPESVLENETSKVLRGFEIQNDLLISARQPDLVIVKKKKNLETSGVVVLTDHRVKLKENEKGDKHLDLAGELKKQQQKKQQTMERERDGALGTIPKRLVKGLEDMEISGREKNSQTTALLRSAIIKGRAHK